MTVAFPRCLRNEDVVRSHLLAESQFSLHLLHSAELHYHSAAYWAVNCSVAFWPRLADRFLTRRLVSAHEPVTLTVTTYAD